MIKPKTYRKKPVQVQASPWFEHGDHPNVDYYRHPPVDPDTGEISVNGILMGELLHSEVPARFRRDDCHIPMDDHGYIDTPEGGHTVCPTDVVITGIQGEHYPCKPDIFAATYEEVSTSD